MALPQPKERDGVPYSGQAPRSATADGVVATPLPELPGFSGNDKKMTSQLQFLLRARPVHHPPDDPFILGLLAEKAKCKDGYQAMHQLAYYLLSIQCQRRALRFPDRIVYGLTSVNGVVQMYGSLYDNAMLVSRNCSHCIRFRFLIRSVVSTSIY